MGDVVSRREIYRGRILRLSLERVRLPNKAETELEVIHHPGAAAVVPFVSAGEILLVRQHRHCAGGSILEVPAGTLHAGESPEACALREVEEETGHRAGRLEPLGWIWTTPGFTDEKIWLFAARDLAPGRQNLDHDEILNVERMSLERAVELSLSGEINDAKSLSAIFRAGGSRGTMGLRPQSIPPTGGTP
jgi:ADP-ribose pyrophosphatase